MKAVALVLLCLGLASFEITGSLVHAQSRSEDVTGWQNTNWGMSRDEIMEIYNDRITVKDCMSKGCIYSIPKYYFHGLHSSVIFSWDKRGGLSKVSIRVGRVVGKLRSGTVVFRSGEMDINEQVVQNIIQSMTQEYGQMVVLHDEDIGDSHIYSKKKRLMWTFPSTIITFERTFTERKDWPVKGRLLLTDVIVIDYQANEHEKL